MSNDFVQGEAPTSQAVAVSRGSDLQEVLRIFGVDAGWGGNLFRWAEGVYDQPDLTDPHRQESWIFAAVDLPSMAVSLVESRFFEGDDENAREITSGPIVDLFKKPNPYLSGADLTVCDMQNMLLTGESFWFMADENGNPVGALGDGPDARIDVPAAIWPVAGDLVELEENKTTGAPENWKTHKTGGVEIKYPVPTVQTHFHAPDKKRPFRGLGPMAAAWSNAAQNHVARRFSSKILKNDGKVAGLIIVGGMLHGSEKRRMEREIDDRWDNQEHAGGHRVLEGDAKFQQLNQSPRDLEWGELLRVNKEEIAAVFQTPGALLGLDTSNYATFAGHFRRYISLRLEPWFKKREREINEGLFPRFRLPSLNRHRIRFDLEPLWRIVQDIAQQGAAVKTLVGVGVPLDDSLRHSGIRTDPIEGGDVSMINASQIPLVSAQAKGRSLALEQQAKAAVALQLAGVDAQAALDLAEIPAKAVEPEPDPEVEEEDDAKAEEGDDEKAHAGPAQAEVRASPFDDAAKAKAAWGVIEAVRRRHRNRMDRGLKGVLFRMKAEQLKALATFAEVGFVPRATGIEPPRLYPELSRGHYFPEVSQRALLEAVRKDDAEREKLLAEDPTALSDFETDCSGAMIATQRAHEPRTWAWLEGHRTLWDRVGKARLVDLARLSVLKISEREIDNLIVIVTEKWRDALAGKVTPAMQGAFEDASKAIAGDMGVSAINATNPRIFAEMASKAIRVVEGTQSDLALRIRSSILKHFESVGVEIGGQEGLQAALKKELIGVKASTTRAFRSHSARALAIARTEVGGSTSSASFEQIRQRWSDGLLRGYVWLTTGQSNVRAPHQPLHGVESTPDVGFVEPISNRHAFHPHGFGVAGLDINCNCAIAGVPADEPPEEPES